MHQLHREMLGIGDIFPHYRSVKLVKKRSCS